MRFICWRFAHYAISPDRVDQEKLLCGTEKSRESQPRATTLSSRIVSGVVEFARQVNTSPFPGIPSCHRIPVSAFDRSEIHPISADEPESCPARIAPRTASCKSPFVTTTPRFRARVGPALKSSGAPSMSVTRPPASSTTRTPPA
jgi:hypothetical protein